MSMKTWFGKLGMSMLGMLLSLGIQPLVSAQQFAPPEKVRNLTPEEREALEYIFIHANPLRSERQDPRLIQNEEVRDAIAETLHEVELVDRLENANPIAEQAMENQYSAITLGMTQVYQHVPSPNDLDKLPLIGHETLHSLQIEVSGSGTALWTWMYLMDVSMMGYRLSQAEVEGYAMQATIQELLQDPVFRNAILTGTIGELPESYDERVRDLYTKYYTLENDKREARLKEMHESLVKNPPTVLH